MALLQLGSVDAVYRRLPVCQRAFQYQLNRGRLSEPVEAALIATLGQDAWRFVCGEVDTLRDVASTIEVHP